MNKKIIFTLIGGLFAANVFAQTPPTPRSPSPDPTAGSEKLPASPPVESISSDSREKDNLHKKGEKKLKDRDGKKVKDRDGKPVTTQDYKTEDPLRPSKGGSTTPAPAPEQVK